MFRQIFILLSATVFNSLAENDFYKGRRQNFNNNNNYNELYGGYDSGLGLNSGGDRDFRKPRNPSSGSGSGLGKEPKQYLIPGSGTEIRGSKLPKYFPSGSGGVGHKLPKYPTTENEVNGDNLIKYPVTGREYIEDKPASSDSRYGGGYGRESCIGILDNLLRENNDQQAVVEEVTDDDGSPEGSVNYNSNYNVVFKDSSRRHLGYRPNRSGSNSWRSSNVNNNINSNSIGSNYRRSYNWRTVRPSSGRVLDYDRDNRGYGRIDESDRDNLFPYGTEQNYDRDSQDYDRKLRGSNMNSNNNYNVMGGRRGNVNYNINTNDFGYGGSDESNENERSETTPKYPGYGKPPLRYNDYDMQGSYDDYITSGYPWIDYTQTPSYDHRDRDDDLEDEEDLLQYEGPSQNTNVNSNSNVNIFSRRNNRNSNANKNSFLRRHKRSADKPQHLSKSVDKKKKGGASISSKTESTTASKPIAEK